MYGFYIYHSFSFVGFEYQTVGWRSGCWSPPSLPWEKIWKGTTYQFYQPLIFANYWQKVKRICLSQSHSLNWGCRVRQHISCQLSQWDLPLTDTSPPPIPAPSFLLFLQIWTLLIWQTAKYCLTINLAMGENFLRDLGGETVNGSQCSRVVNKFEKLRTKSFPNTPPHKWVFASVLDWSPWAN